MPPLPFVEVDEIPLSRPKRNISRDFADGVGNLDGNLMRSKFQGLGCFPMAVWEGRNLPGDGMHPLGHMVFESVWKFEVYYRTELCFFFAS